MAGHGATNGGGLLGSGLLHDTGGNDSYVAGSGATNGGAYLGSGLLHDTGGNDSYLGGDVATNGGGVAGLGALIDEGGTDSYTAGAEATNGAGPSVEIRHSTEPIDIHAGPYVIHVPSVDQGLPMVLISGLLLDLGGSGDRYSDRSGNTADEIDQSEIPKGAMGVQLDGCHSDNPAIDEHPLVKQHCSQLAGSPTRMPPAPTTTTTTIPPTTTTSIPSLNENCQVGNLPEPEPASSASTADGGWVVLVLLVVALAIGMAWWKPGSTPRRHAAAAALLVAMVGAASLPAVRPRTGSGQQTRRKAKKPPVVQPANLPIRFDTNVGQAEADVAFIAHDGPHTLFLTKTGIVSVVTANPEAGPPAAPPINPPMPSVAALAMKLSGANPKPVIEGLDRLEGHSNYLTGNDPGQWRRGVAGYSKVVYRGAWPGIDMVVHADNGAPQYDMVVAPGADPARVKVDFSGQKAVHVDDDGNLVLDTALGSVRQRRP